MSFFNRTAQALLNSLFGKTSNFGALASAPTLYVGLSSTTPAEDGTNITEPTGGAYARVSTVAAAAEGGAKADLAASILANAAALKTAVAPLLGAKRKHLAAIYGLATVAPD